MLVAGAASVSMPRADSHGVIPSHGPGERGSSSAGSVSGSRASLSHPWTPWLGEELNIHPSCGHLCKGTEAVVCDVVKDHFSLSITGRTGLVMPYWRPSSGASLGHHHGPDASVTVGLIVQHGDSSDGDDYTCAIYNGLRKHLILDAAVQQVLIVGPQFYQSWNDTVRPRQANELYWGDDNEISWNSWQNGNVPSPSQPFETPQHRYGRLNSFKGGGNSSAGSKASLSSFDVYDQIMGAMMDKNFYPNMKSIIFLGHSGGAQVVQRHAIASTLEARPGVSVSYFVANPGSVTYLTDVRPILAGAGSFPALTSTGEGEFPAKTPTPASWPPCSNTTLLTHNWSFAVPKDDLCDDDQGYTHWALGIGGKTTPGTAYVAARQATEMRQAYLRRNVTYVSGSADTCPCLSSPNPSECQKAHNCAWNTAPQGFCHMEIVHAFYQHVQHVYAEVAESGECSACRDRPLTHRFVPVPGVGHSHCSIFQSKELLAAMFADETAAAMQAATGRGNGTATSSDEFAQWYPK